MTVLHARHALTETGWQRDVTVTLAEGRIASVAPGHHGAGQAVGLLLPAPVNLHSHCFQRAMAGLTERRDGSGRDSFWTWRDLMYRFLAHLTPEDVGAIAAQAMVEMAEAGYGAVAEFHYLHHQAEGQAYADLAELSGRIVQASAETGLGLTLLPVLYQQGGCDGRALGAGQLRFGNDHDRFAGLLQAAEAHLATLPADAVLGLAPHSLRAVTPEALALAAQMRPGAPLHLHLAEQQAEVDEVLAHRGARPVEWLLQNADVDPRWCLIHSTQMVPDETTALARTGAVAGLCPITEANLGDGIFDGLRWQAASGRFGVGTDSNVQISLTGELRLYEYSQRLRDRGRAMLATADQSTGRVLWQSAVQGGAQAAGRAAGGIAPGRWADLVAYDDHALALDGLAGDALLDALIFASDLRCDALWSAGRQIVAHGRHIARDRIETRFRATMAGLRGRM